MLTIAVDTETTGLDVIHGCRPYLIIVCSGPEEDNDYFWGHINQHTREVFWDEDVLEEVQEILDRADKIVFHNTQFDMGMLESVGIKIDDLWDKVEDTVLAAHLFASDDAHGLKPITEKYLHYNNDDEEDLKIAVMDERRKYQNEYDLAKQGHRHFPAQKSGPWWPADMWLAPKEVLRYGLRDVERTWNMWDAFKVGLTKENLWGPYKIRKKLLRICYNITKTGQRLNADKTQEYIQSLRRKMQYIKKFLEKEIGCHYEFNWNKKSHLKTLLIDHLKLPIISRTENGGIRTSKDVIAEYIKQYPSRELNALKYALALQTELQYVHSYFVWSDDDYVIHSRLNITGTRETRQSSSDPNQQNITAKLKKLFEPAPGFIWVDADFANIELRIWAYATNNQELMKAFRQGISVHMLIMTLLYPKQAARYEKNPDDLVLGKLYRRVKGGTFALIYGASESKADETYGYKGATKKIFERFPGIEEYTASLLAQVEQNKVELKRHCVYTLFEYPLDVPPDGVYKVCNFYVQGSAGMIMTKAMIAIANNPRYIESGSQMIGQVHDSAKTQIPIHAGLVKTVNSIMLSMSTCVEDELAKTPVDFSIQINPADKDNPHVKELLSGI